MKTFLLAALLITLTGSTFGKTTNNQDKSPVLGSWKYSRESIVNDFQQVSIDINKNEYVSEYFVFEPNNKFKHEFIDKNGMVVKTLKGKWKIFNNRIKIEYTDIDYSLTLDYFFLDKDLVLGQNFNHIIFSKDANEDKNIALK